MSSNVGRPVARPAQVADQMNPAVSISSFAEKYPALFDMIGKSRKNEKFHERGCFTVFFEDGVFKVSLNDRPNGQSCFVSSPQLGQALCIADAGIRSGTLRWRANKRYRAQAKALYT